MTSMTEAEHGDALSAYEAKRRERMQANAAMLQSLGIERFPQRPGVTPRPLRKKVYDAPRRSSTRLRTKQQQAKEVDHGDADDDDKGKSEQESKSPPTTEEKLLALPIVPQSERRRRSVITPEQLGLGIVDLEVEPGYTAAPRRKANSSRFMMVDVDAVHARWLGRALLPLGKRPIMEALGASDPTSSGLVPSFSQMSGLQPWANAFVLFVNVQGATGYENAFTEVRAPTTGALEAVHFRWFARKQQHEQSPVIQRLARAQRGRPELMMKQAALDGGLSEMVDSDPTTTEATGEASNAAAEPAPVPPPVPAPDSVLLFVRQLDGPYVYCGRLGYLGHDASRRPLEFRWELLDAQGLEWTAIRRMVDGGGGGGGGGGEAGAREDVAEAEEAEEGTKPREETGTEEKQ